MFLFSDGCLSSSDLQHVIPKPLTRAMEEDKKEEFKALEKLRSDMYPEEEKQQLKRKDQDPCLDFQKNQEIKRKKLGPIYFGMSS